MKYASKINKEIDQGWRTFWARRGYMQPFEVSQTTLGEYQLPVKITYKSK